MNWRPTASINTLKARARLHQQVRTFFHERGVLEVETPALSQAGNTDPHIDSFSTNSTTNTAPRYLHTSPEYPMKRLLAAGSGDIYQICKVWRQEESGSRHNPEFTMLEYYRVGFSYQQLMQEVTTLLHTLIPTLKPKPNILSYRQAFLDHLQLDPHTASIEELQHCAQQHHIDLQGTLAHQDWLDLLLTHCIEPHFPTNRLIFIHQYPAAQCALAKTVTIDGQAIAERFEVYCGALELGNGYQEQTDYTANYQQLHNDAAQRGHDMPVDEHFLAAMQSGMPESAGVAIGLDRVLLAATGQQRLSDVLSFAWDHA